jgi:hypothetical protein
VTTTFGPAIGDLAALPLREADDPRVRCYRSAFADAMEMHAGRAAVGSYLDSHEGWFRRCAEPMRVHPVGRNGYELTLGRFGNLGFEVEPTIALELLPQQQGTYRIVTIPRAADAAAPSTLYDVDFNASLRLEEDAGSLTNVRWTLDLCVWIRLPGMITLLPEQIVQSSGDHVLRQIVRQVSRKLTWKVQEDFHRQAGLPVPPRRRAPF